MPRLGPSGEVQMWVGANADIHQQKLLVAGLLGANETQATLADQAYATTKQVRQQRKTLFQVFMEVPVATSVVRSTDHRYEFANRTFLTSAGQPNLLGHTVAAVFPEFMAQSSILTPVKVLRTGQLYSARQVLVQLGTTAAPPPTKDT